mgnify:CR=1 FL=1
MKKMNNIVIVALCVAILGVLLMECGKISSNNKKAIKNENTAFSGAVKGPADLHIIDRSCGIRLSGRAQ